MSIRRGYRETLSVLGLSRKRAGSELPTRHSELGDCVCVCDGGGEEDPEARLEIGSGSLAAVERDGTNGVEKLGAGTLGLFSPFCPLTVLPPPLYPRGAGLRCGCRLISVFPPFFTFLGGLQTYCREIISAFYSCLRD